MTARTKPRGTPRLFDGWGAGLVVLLIAGSAIVLALPRAVAPEELPAPQVDGARLRETMTTDETRASTAVAQQLDVDVRAVGREIRAYNRAASAGDEQALVSARAELVRAAQKALRHGDEPLLSLRAYQMLRFVDEVRRWRASGEVTAELRELGGDFARTVARNRWCRDGRLALDERQLRVLFKKRWNDVVGVRGGAFELTLDEDRVRFGFLLAHPFHAQNDRTLREDNPALGRLREEQQRLRLIDGLSERDPSYPADLARGVVSYHLGQYPLASESFRRHLEAHPDGPHTLRARNYLKASLDMSHAGVF